MGLFHAFKINQLPTDQQPNMLSWQPGWPEATPVSIRRRRPRSRPSPNRAAMRAGGFPGFYFGLDDAAAHTSHSSTCVPKPPVVYLRSPELAILPVTARVTATLVTRSSRITCLRIRPNPREVVL